MAFKSRNGQSLMEYTMLIIIASAAIIAMTTYVLRSSNARLKQEQTELDYYKVENNGDGGSSF